MKRLIPLILINFILYSCRSTNLVTINVLEPAPVTVPPYIKHVGIANRSLSSSQSKVVDIVDKIFTIEGANLDKIGAASSITGLSDELKKDDRFTEIITLPGDELRTSVPGMFPAPLSWDEIEKICKANNLDALFTLELFDTDTKIDYEAHPVKINTPLGGIPAIQQQANMRVMVKTGWRIYDPVGKNILDEFPIDTRLTFTARGINPTIAAKALIGRKEAVKEAGTRSGRDYAFRIVPWWVKVRRDYYVKGSDQFAIAKRRAQTGNWNGAAELWKSETNHTNGKIAGRACYNMAIISEINGDLDAAIQWAQKAYEQYNNRLALNYVNILRERKISNHILEDQQSAFVP